MASAASAPALRAGETHVWGLDLDAGGADASLLSADEKERAARYRFERDASRFVAARCGLRRVVSLYAGLPAGRLVFAYGSNGKPSLAGGPAGLRFNLSHSDGRAAVAVRVGEELGIDIERVRPIPDAGRMVERYFSARARAHFDALRAEERDEAFLRLWTRQEAYLKALGEGLAGALDGEPSDGWRIVEFSPAPGYVGALAARGDCAPPRLLELD